MLNIDENLSIQQRGSLSKDGEGPRTLEFSRDVSPGTAAIIELHSIEQEWEVCTKEETGSILLKNVAESGNQPDVWLEVFRMAPIPKIYHLI